MQNKTLASVVKEAREKIGISQRELSRKTGIDNNTLAKIEKGERKKPNVLSLKKLSVILNLNLKELMSLSGYSLKDIDASTNNTYSTLAIISDNAPVLVLDDLINKDSDKLFIKKVIKELFNTCDINKLDILNEMNLKERNRAIKLLKKYIAENNNDIEKINTGIEKLKKLLSENSTD